jgi:hypothetical protein
MQSCSYWPRRTQLSQLQANTKIKEGAGKQQVQKVQMGFLYLLRI